MSGSFSLPPDAHARLRMLDELQSSKPTAGFGDDVTVQPKPAPADVAKTNQRVETRHKRKSA